MLKSILSLSPVAAGLFAACFLTACADGGSKTCAAGDDCSGNGSGLDGADSGSGKLKDAGKDAKASTTPDATLLANKKYLPCDVKPIIESKCSLCHGDPTAFSAPMSLVTAADFQATAQDKRAMYANVHDKINETTPSLKMPPSTNDPLSDDELNTLNTWLAQGAPGTDKSCSTA
ncbi:MAG: hypothetical protein JWN04_6549, partial [Myxococcaceae bacterium]|nr:hypothetical protein [Myxococcaceae bacterium]